MRSTNLLSHTWLPHSKLPYDDLLAPLKGSTRLFLQVLELASDLLISVVHSPARSNACDSSVEEMDIKIFYNIRSNSPYLATLLAIIA